MVTEKIKIKGISRVVNDTYNTMHNFKLIVKEIKYTNNNRKFRKSISQEERLNTARIFMFF